MREPLKSIEVTVKWFSQCDHYIGFGYCICCEFCSVVCHVLPRNETTWYRSRIPAQCCTECIITHPSSLSLVKYCAILFTPRDETGDNDKVVCAVKWKRKMETGICLETENVLQSFTPSYLGETPLFSVLSSGLLLFALWKQHFEKHHLVLWRWHLWNLHYQQIIN